MYCSTLSSIYETEWNSNREISFVPLGFTLIWFPGGGRRGEGGRPSNYSQFARSFSFELNVLLLAWSSSISYLFLIVYIYTYILSYGVNMHIGSRWRPHSCHAWSIQLIPSCTPRKRLVFLIAITGSVKDPMLVGLLFICVVSSTCPHSHLYFVLYLVLSSVVSRPLPGLFVICISSSIGPRPHLCLILN